MYSSQTLVSDGTVTRVDLSIEYLSKDDIQVFVDDALLPANGYAWTWASDTAINFNKPVQLGMIINVRRSTAYDNIKHIFEVGGAVFKDRNVDENFRQVLYWCQDFIEGKTVKDVWNNLNMHGFRVHNLGNATDPYDAVSLGQYQADAMGAWQASRVAQSLNELSMDKLNTTQGYSDAMQLVLESDDTALDVPFPNGSFVPTVAKRTVDLTSAVTSVNGKIGDVVVADTDIAVGDINQHIQNSFFTVASDTPQREIDAFSNDAKLTRGNVYFKPDNDITLAASLNIEKKRIDLIGANSVLRWGGTSDYAMIRVYDSSYTKIKNMSLIGNATNPPLAAILFDNNNLARTGTNEKCVVEDVLVGRRFLADTDGGGSINVGVPYGRVQHGVLVRSGGYGNNDEFTFRNVVANDADVAGFSLEGDQHIWTSFENTLANGCATGYKLGSNVMMQNIQCNRNSVVDVDGIRNIEVTINGLYSEHPKMVLKSTAASFFVRGGKWVKNLTVAAPIIQFTAGGTLKLENITFTSNSDTLNYLQYNNGTTKDGLVYIKHCNFTGGNNRNFYRINTATVGTKNCAVDIEHNNFRFKTKAPYYDEIKDALTIPASSVGLYSSTTGTKIGVGKFIHSALGVATTPSVQVPVTLDTSVARTRVINRSASPLSIPQTNVRCMDMQDYITQQNTASVASLTIPAGGVYMVEIPLWGARLGDIVIPTTTTLLNTVMLYARVVAENTAAVLVESIGTGAVTLTNQVLGVGLLNVSSVSNFSSNYLTSQMVIPAKTTVARNVTCVGAQVGSHCFVGSSAGTLGSLLITAKCDTPDVVTVTAYNPTVTESVIPVNSVLNVHAIL